MVFRAGDTWAMEARWQGETHRLELNGTLNYQGPLFSARLDPETFETVHLEAAAGARPGDELSLEPAATMYVLLNGLKESLPHLPTALPSALAAEDKILHPGYLE